MLEMRLSISVYNSMRKGAVGAEGEILLSLNALGVSLILSYVCMTSKRKHALYYH